MLKINRCLTPSWNPISHVVFRKCFSVLFMNNKRFDPAIFDVLVQDIDENDLYNQISRLLGKPYLHSLEPNEKQFEEIRKGIIYGSGRGLIALPTRTDKTQPIWIHYLLDTGAPYTFLSQLTLKTLKANLTQNKFSVLINSHSNSVRLSTAHFSKINILGMDYLENRKQVHYDMLDKIITVTDRKKG